MEIKTDRRDSRVELRNVRIVDVASGALMPEGSVIQLQNGVITGIKGPGSVHGAEIPLVSYDCKGLTAIPALMNTHCHISLSLPALTMSMKSFSLVKKNAFNQRMLTMRHCIERGITNVRDAITEDLHDTDVIRSQMSSRVPGGGPRILQAVNVGMLGSCWSPRRNWRDRMKHSLLAMPFIPYENVRSGVVTFPVDADDSLVRIAIDRAIDERTAQMIKIYDQREKKLTYKPGAPLMLERQLRSLVDQARRRGVSTVMHHTSIESFRRGVQAGVHVLAHLPIDDELTNADVAACRESGTIVEPTLSVAYGYAWKVAGGSGARHSFMAELETYRERTAPDTMRPFWLPELYPVVMEGFEKIRRGKLRAMGILNLSAPLRYFSPSITNGLMNFLKLIDGGVTIACGNDGGIPPCTTAMIGHELTLMDFLLRIGGHHNGLSGSDALRIASLNSARDLGIADHFGSLEEGKVADIALIDGDPLQDLTCIGEPVAALFKDGQLINDNTQLEMRRSE